MTRIGAIRGLGFAAMLAVLASMGPVDSIDAQEREFPGWDRIPSRERLSAIRAARVVGMRDLGEAILSLSIDGRRLSEHLENAGAEPGLAGRLIRGFKADEPRFTGDGTVRVRVWIPIEVAWSGIRDLGLSLPDGVDRASFARAVGGKVIEVDGMGRPAGFAAAPRPAPSRPERVPSPRKEEDEEQGSLSDRDRRFATPLPRARPLPGFDRSRENSEIEPGWRTVSERVIRSWEVPSEESHADCGEDGRWETIETRVIERRIVSERIVVR